MVSLIVGDDVVDDDVVDDDKLFNALPLFINGVSRNGEDEDLGLDLGLIGLGVKGEELGLFGFWDIGEESGVIGLGVKCELVETEDSVPDDFFLNFFIWV